MAHQLPLLDRPEREPEWRIDEQTRAIGRRGLALARAALAATTASDPVSSKDADRRPTIQPEHRTAA